jgi:hypothetical protein
MKITDKMIEDILKSAYYADDNKTLLCDKNYLKEVFNYEVEEPKTKLEQAEEYYNNYDNNIESIHQVETLYEYFKQVINKMKCCDNCALIFTCGNESLSYCKMWKLED